MIAVYCENYGPIEDAELKEMEKPVPNEVTPKS